MTTECSYETTCMKLRNLESPSEKELLPSDFFFFSINHCVDIFPVTDTAMAYLVDKDTVHTVEEFSFLIQIPEVAILANIRPVAGFHS